MGILVENTMKVSTGIYLKDNFDPKKYVSVKHDEKDVDNVDYGRDIKGQVVINLPSNLKGQLVDIQLKNPNSFYKGEKETDLQFLTRLDWSFKKIIDEAPQPILRPHQIRLSFFNKFDYVLGNVSPIPMFMYKSAFYFFSSLVNYRTEIMNIDTTKPIMFMFQRKDEDPKSFISTSSEEKSVGVLDLNRDLIVRFFDFDLKGKNLNIKNNV